MIDKRNPVALGEHRSYMTIMVWLLGLLFCQLGCAQRPVVWYPMDKYKFEPWTNWQLRYAVGDGDSFLLVKDRGATSCRTAIDSIGFSLLSDDRIRIRGRIAPGGMDEDPPGLIVVGSFRKYIPLTLTDSQRRMGGVPAVWVDESPVGRANVAGEFEVVISRKRRDTLFVLNQICVVDMYDLDSLSRDLSRIVSGSINEH